MFNKLLIVLERLLLVTGICHVNHSRRTGTETEQTKVIVYGIITDPDPVGWVQELSFVLRSNIPHWRGDKSRNTCGALHHSERYYDTPTLHKTHPHTNAYTLSVTLLYDTSIKVEVVTDH